MGVTASPVSASQTRVAKLGQPQPSTRRPSGLNEALLIDPAFSFMGGVRGRPVCTSHTRAVESGSTPSKRLPSGLKDGSVIRPPSREKELTTLPESTSTKRKLVHVRPT